MEVVTPSGNRFYMTMVDDYSRYSVIYLLKRKSDASEKLKEYCNLMKNQFGRYPKCIRSDGGGEYSDSGLKQYFADKGIVRQMSAPYSPQQNGVAERKNRYLKEMMRCMLFDSGLDKKFWGEAINTANYLQNRCPSSTVDRTPYELWNKKKPCYDYLKVFGSEAYVHVPKEKRRALDKKSEKSFFVGYEGQKAYRFLNNKTCRITISRDTKFEEKCCVKEFSPSVPASEPPVKRGVMTVPLVIPSLNSDNEQVCDEQPVANSFSENDSDSSYESASGSVAPHDEITRISMRQTKSVPPKRLIEASYAAETAAFTGGVEPKA